MRNLSRVFAVVAGLLVSAAVVQPGSASATDWGDFQIRNAANQQCLTIGADNYSIGISGCSGGRYAFQDWEVNDDPVPANYYRLISYAPPQPGKCLDSAWGHGGTGAPPVARYCADFKGPDEEWYLSSVSGSRSYIQSRATGQFLGLGADGKPHLYKYPNEAYGGQAGVIWCLRTDWGSNPRQPC
ncbi:RICIN domain-containing protein [Kribbella sp. NPDC051718]|uniref:RICIN domain-containing protein n=1 Tax=Kribbella sp. NPDC051718 TaxID=3155168 RepID=UPI0034376422